MDDYAICWKCNHNYFNAKGIAYDKGLMFFKCPACNEHSIGFFGQKHICHECARKLNVCVFCEARLK